MRSIESNLIVGKSKSFALRCIRLYQLLIKERGEFVLSKQLLRSGTSIGANVKEAIRGQSKADFAMKLNIALKEASESEYWIELLGESGILTEQEFASIHQDCRELIKILTSILKTTFKSIHNS